jgi:hypothetical protein
MLAIPYLVVTKLLPKLDISSTKTNYLASLFFADNVNIAVFIKGHKNL